MLERAMIKKAVARSAGFLLRSLIGALVIYLVITAVVLSAGLVSLLTGWYPFAIESGPLGFLGYTMVIDNKTNFHVSSEISWYGVLVLVVAAGILIRVWSAELRKAGPPMTCSMGMFRVFSPSSHRS